MVESRWMPRSAAAIAAGSVGSPLRRVEVKRFHPGGTVGSIRSPFARLRRFLREGLDLTFFTDDIPAREYYL
ncbi:hypothetical protein FIBSPDRAFT_855505 [Athelia psychrophila]|uniref:Uncharacterized protein n=1 Tax=Athelia psychrophila TaxID=1759441 RepID=A0A166P9T0_9AGAM|nr:hypothetical protein FIBSPDRAFT_855505 [Fibularhizoctonia sp. CBS 109695]